MAPQQPEDQVAPQQVAPEKNESTNVHVAAPPYVDYCYKTYWKGTLLGSGRNYFEYDRCGDYGYNMAIDVLFSVPFDLAAYLDGKDFNFNDCPSLPEGVANDGGKNIIYGSFRSERIITTYVNKTVDRWPDRQSTSTGALYIGMPHGLAFTTYPQAAAQNAARNYPHMMSARCTWGANVQANGYDEALLFGSESGNFSYDSTTRVVRGKWAMNNTVSGIYTISRTD